MPILSSKRLTLDNAEIFCEMMNIDNMLLHEAYNEPGKAALCGAVSIKYNPLSQCFVFSFRVSVK